ncbi:MAG: 50S ribosomal protein L17, partial [Candidatus Krumholzibacteria bacterium]|nr:50S ribosomal protein L17 [Candidatus Krumholzibacteria bacterium]
MRHRVDHRKLNRTASHRKAMLNNMVTSLFDKERITTTDAKAKEARRLAEKLITRARKGYNAHQEGLSLKEAGKDDEARQMEAVALAHWRQAGRYVRKTSVLKKLFEEIAPQFVERPGGYTRIVKMSRRLGDNAKTVLLELVGTQQTEIPVSKKKGEEAEEEPAAKAKSKGKTKVSKKDAKDEKDKDSSSSTSKGAKSSKKAPKGEKDKDDKPSKKTKSS